MPKPHHNSSLVSTMIKQGFISGPLFSSPSPPIAAKSLFDIMSVDPDKAQIPMEAKLQERISSCLSQSRWGPGDITLTVSSSSSSSSKTDEGPASVTMTVHRRVLMSKSGFFADKLRRRRRKSGGEHALCSVDIVDCDDVEVYVEVVLLMYSAVAYGGDVRELKNELVGIEVSKILTLLKISSAIKFDEGIKACVEYLEAMPWPEEEEEIIVSHLNQLKFVDGPRPNEALQRVASEQSTSSSSPDEIFLKLSLSIMQSKEDKARKEMKSLVARLLKEDRGDSLPTLKISRDILYHLCRRCITSLVLCLSSATCSDENRATLMADVAREADNIQWLVGILIHQKMGDELVELWADQAELALLHSKIPVVYRHEISKVTARLCVSISRGEVLVLGQVRYALLRTWLDALYDDFGFMRRFRKMSDKKSIEDGLGGTILTLTMDQQQSILMDWFERFLDRGDDCPNIQSAFEVWWRRAFVNRYVVEPRLQMTVSDGPN